MGWGGGGTPTRCSGAIEVQQRTAPERGLLLVPKSCERMYRGVQCGARLYPPSIESIAGRVASTLTVVVCAESAADTES
jgi:hypothetical protein